MVAAILQSLMLSGRRKVSIKISLIGNTSLYRYTPTSGRKLSVIELDETSVISCSKTAPAVLIVYNFGIY